MSGVLHGMMLGSGSRAAPVYVNSDSRSFTNGTPWNFTPGESNCVVIGVCVISFFGNGQPTLSQSTFDGNALTVIQSRFLTNYEPDGVTQAVFSWLLGATGNFAAATSYPIVLDFSGANSGFSSAVAAMSFKGSSIGFGTASVAGGFVTPSSTATASVTITSTAATSLIGFGARQANSPALTGGTVRQTITDSSSNVRVHMSQVDNATSQTFSTTGGAVAGFALT